jgi:hypothetical protein
LSKNSTSSPSSSATDLNGDNRPLLAFITALTSRFSPIMPIWVEESSGAEDGWTSVRYTAHATKRSSLGQSQAPMAQSGLRRCPASRRSSSNFGVIKGKTCPLPSSPPQSPMGRPGNRGCRCSNALAAFVNRATERLRHRGEHPVILIRWIAHEAASLDFPRL